MASTPSRLWQRYMCHHSLMATFSCDFLTGATPPTLYAVSRCYYVRPGRTAGCRSRSLRDWASEAAYQLLRGKHLADSQQHGLLPTHPLTPHSLLNAIFPVDVCRLRAICHSQVCRCLGVGSPSSGRECRHEGVSNLLHMPCSVPAQDIPEAMHFALKWYIFRNQNMQNVLIGLTLADAHFHFFTWIYFVDTWVCPTFFSCATPLPAGHLRVISAVRGSWGGQSDCRTQCLGEGLSHSRGWTMAMGNSY